MNIFMQQSLNYVLIAYQRSDLVCRSVYLPVTGLGLIALLQRFPFVCWISLRHWKLAKLSDNCVKKWKEPLGVGKNNFHMMHWISIFRFAWNNYGMKYEFRILKWRHNLRNFGVNKALKLLRYVTNEPWLHKFVRLSVKWVVYRIPQWV